MTKLIFLFILLAGYSAIAEKTSSTAAKALNPDISANFLGLYKYSNRNIADGGPQLQEVETQFTADVDPYFRAVALLSISRAAGKTEYTIDPEEVYAETLSIPSITLRAGKFKAAMGRHNTLHTHALPFIDSPLISEQILGAEGLNEVGASAAVLVPFPWFSEITLQAFTGENDLFKSGDRMALVPVAHLKNLWDLSDSSTIETGLSGASGRNQWDDRTHLFGADLTYKWRPTRGGKYHALIWSTEYLVANRRAITPSDTTLGGIASWIQYQFAERWWAQARTEYVGLPVSSDSVRQRRYSALLGFFPSEFSGFRVQYSLLDDGADKVGHSVQFQANISIGAHPAHTY